MNDNVAIMRAADYAARKQAVIAALLHDAVEDQGVSGAEIADLFGPTAASLVAELTDDKSLPKQVARTSRSPMHHTRATAHRLSSSPPSPATYLPSLVARPVAQESETGLCGMGEGRCIGPAVQTSESDGPFRRGGEVGDEQHRATRLILALELDARIVCYRALPNGSHPRKGFRVRSDDVPSRGLNFVGFEATGDHRRKTGLGNNSGSPRSSQFDRATCLFTAIGGHLSESAWRTVADQRNSGMLCPP